MKTKNTRLHYDDLKSGMTIYISHPTYGIEVIKVLDPKRFYSLDHHSRTAKDTFFKSDSPYSPESVNDDGLNYGESYNYRRAFRKLKHAQEWANKMKTDPGFLKHQQELEDSIHPVFGDLEEITDADLDWARENYGLNAE